MKYEEIKIKEVQGRYVVNEDVIPVLQRMKKGLLKEVGKSVQDSPIYTYDIGDGNIKILMWSQMHGNESTTTKAVLDLVSFLNQDSDKARLILSKYSIRIIPILNPDGAYLYTRPNSVGVDLNRDSQDLSQPESRVLKEVYTSFVPDFGFNLHDQRTIFGVDGYDKPATVSFLSPSYNESRDINEVRKKSMSVINIMNRRLQTMIPNQVGRFDDGFNLNCIGDTLQYNGVPTILFESGHFPFDYQREETRKYIFFSIVEALSAIYQLDFSVDPVDEYMKIPQNNKSFCDILLKNVEVHSEKNKKNTNFAILYKEVLKGGKIVFEPYISAIGDDTITNGHVEYDMGGEVFEGEIEIGQEADFVIGKHQFIKGVKVQ